MSSVLFEVINGKIVPRTVKVDPPLVKRETLSNSYKRLALPPPRDDYGVHYLSEKHKDIMRFITRFYDAHGFTPTVREIERGVKWKFKRDIQRSLIKLDYLKWIRKDPQIYRGIVLLKRLK